MSKKTQRKAVWNEEIVSSSIKAVIADRLKFHGGLYLMFVVRFTGCAVSTAKKHLDRLVGEGSATKELNGDDWLYRHQPNT